MRPIEVLAGRRIWNWLRSKGRRIGFQHGYAIAGGRPKPQEVVAYWPALLAREEIERTLEVTVEAI